jgi:hypothetical protein
VSTTTAPEVSAEVPESPLVKRRLIEPVMVTRLVAAALAFTCSAIVAYALLFSWIRHYVNEDQALLWAAARSWSRLQPEQPNFWGQSYGTTAEAIPAAFLNALGIGYATGLPLGVALINLGTWLVLGAAAFVRRRFALSTVALGALALMSPGYLVLAVAYNTAVGRLIMAFAMAAALLAYARWWRLCASLGLAALAVVVDNSTAVVAAPLGVYLVVLCLREPPLRATLRRATSWWLLGAALVPAASFAAFSRWWYRAHPADLTHPAPSFKPSLARLVDNLSNPTRHFGVFGLELWSTIVLPALVVLVLLIYLIVRRQWVALGCLGATTLLLLAVLAVPRANDYLPTPYYPAARVVFVLPMAVWFVAIVAVSPARRPGGGTALLPLLLALLCVVSTAVRYARWDTQTAQLRADAVAYPNYPLTPTSDMIKLCRDVGRIVSETGVHYTVFQLRTPAYACAGLDPDITTVYPPYERRSWLLRGLLESQDSTFLYIGEPPSCTGTPLICSNVGVNATEIARPAGMTAREALALLKVPIRPPFDRPSP